MVAFISNPPDAQSLMNSSRSFGNYDLAGALSDLIDNSLTAKSRKIDIFCIYNYGNPEVRVIDDGHGMSEQELRRAMRPASQNPLEERSADDLGRFGWGMKSASFSQCKKLTVISKRNGQLSGAFWDLENLDQWQMGVLEGSEVSEKSQNTWQNTDGTEIIWENCDRLSENGSISEADFNSLIAFTRNRLALIFHRYLDGQLRGRSITMKMNGQAIDAYDPFYSHHDATQALPPEDLYVRGEKIVIRPFILPHYSKLALAEHQKLGGEEGFLKNQGFYVYRKHRLIINGTWFRLVRYGELSQLVRIGVEIPNTLDDLWKITVDKTDAQLPAVLRDRLKQIVEGLKKRSSKVHRSKGGRLSHGSSVAVWHRYARGGEVRYSINHDHPLISDLLNGETINFKERASAALKVIEQGFPVEAFQRDAKERPDDIHQTLGNPQRFREFLESSIPIFLVRADGDFAKMVATLRKTEPYSLNWKPVEEFLEEKGWFDGSR